jgi:hypothetical protein
MRIPIILTVAVLVALAAAVSVSGCQTPQQQTGTLAGGAIGAGTAVTAPPPGRCAQWAMLSSNRVSCTRSIKPPASSASNTP